MPAKASQRTVSHGDTCLRKGWDLCVANASRSGVAARTRSSLNLQLIDGKIFSQKKSAGFNELGISSSIVISDSENTTSGNDVGIEELEVSSNLLAECSINVVMDEGWANPNLTEMDFQLGIKGDLECVDKW